MSGVRGADASFFATNATLCVAGVCAVAGRATQLPIGEWWAAHILGAVPHLSPTVRNSCADCKELAKHPGHRPCSHSAERQESFVVALARAMGVERGVFLELGGHNGLAASNTVYSEACLGWRGLMIEANPVSFAKLRGHRPGVLAAHGAVCPTRGRAVFAARRSVNAARRGVSRCMACTRTRAIACRLRLAHRLPDHPQPPRMHSA